MARTYSIGETVKNKRTGQTGKVVDINPTTGNPIVEWSAEPMPEFGSEGTRTMEPPAPFGALPDKKTNEPPALGEVTSETSEEAQPSINYAAYNQPYEGKIERDADGNERMYHGGKWKAVERDEGAPIGERLKMTTGDLSTPEGRKYAADATYGKDKTFETKDGLWLDQGDKVVLADPQGWSNLSPAEFGKDVAEEWPSFGRGLAQTGGMVAALPPAAAGTVSTGMNPVAGVGITLAGGGLGGAAWEQGMQAFGERQGTREPKTLGQLAVKGAEDFVTSGAESGFSLLTENVLSTFARPLIQKGRNAVARFIGAPFGMSDEAVELASKEQGPRIFKATQNMPEAEAQAHSSVQEGIANLKKRMNDDFEQTVIPAIPQDARVDTTDLAEQVVAWAEQNNIADDALTLKTPEVKHAMSYMEALVKDLDTRSNEVGRLWQLKKTLNDFASWGETSNNTSAFARFARDFQHRVNDKVLEAADAAGSGDLVREGNALYAQQKRTLDTVLSLFPDSDSPNAVRSNLLSLTAGPTTRRGKLAAEALQALEEAAADNPELVDALKDARAVAHAQRWSGNDQTGMTRTGASALMGALASQADRGPGGVISAALAPQVFSKPAAKYAIRGIGKVADVLDEGVRPALEWSRQNGRFSLYGAPSAREQMYKRVTQTGLRRPWGISKDLEDENHFIVSHSSGSLFKPTETNPLGEFDFEKMGTGEGAQIRGWGAYSAEGGPTHKSYRDSLGTDRTVALELPQGTLHEEDERFTTTFDVLRRLGGETGKTKNDRFASDIVKKYLADNPNATINDLRQHIQSKFAAHGIDDDVFNMDIGQTAARMDSSFALKFAQKVKFDPARAFEKQWLPEELDKTLAGPAQLEYISAMKKRLDAIGAPKQKVWDGISPATLLMDATDANKYFARFPVDSIESAAQAALGEANRNVRKYSDVISAYSSLLKSGNLQTQDASDVLAIAIKKNMPEAAEISEDAIADSLRRYFAELDAETETDGGIGDASNFEGYLADASIDPGVYEHVKSIISTAIGSTAQDAAGDPLARAVNVARTAIASVPESQGDWTVSDIVTLGLRAAGLNADEVKTMDLLMESQLPDDMYDVYNFFEFAQTDEFEPFMQNLVAKAGGAKGAGHVDDLERMLQEVSANGGDEQTAINMLRAVSRKQYTATKDRGYSYKLRVPKAWLPTMVDLDRPAIQSEGGKTALGLMRERLNTARSLMRKSSTAKDVERSLHNMAALLTAKRYYNAGAGEDVIGRSYGMEYLDERRANMDDEEILNNWLRSTKLFETADELKEDYFGKPDMSTLEVLEELFTHADNLEQFPETMAMFFEEGALSTADGNTDLMDGQLAYDSLSVWHTPDLLTPKSIAQSNRHQTRNRWNQRAASELLWKNGVKGSYFFDAYSRSAQQDGIGNKNFVLFGGSGEKGGFSVADRFKRKKKGADALVDPYADVVDNATKQNQRRMEAFGEGEQPPRYWAPDEAQATDAEAQEPAFGVGPEDQYQGGGGRSVVTRAKPPVGQADDYGNAMPEPEPEEPVFGQYDAPAGGRSVVPEKRERRGIPTSADMATRQGRTDDYGGVRIPPRERKPVAKKWALESDVRQLQTDLKNAPPIRISTEPLFDDAGTPVEALYDTRAQTVWVNPSAIGNDKRALREAVLHEVVGHDGIRNILGEKLDDFLRRVPSLYKDQYQANISAGMDPQEAAEEVLADLAERGKVQGSFAQLIAAAKQALKLDGLELSKNDVMFLLSRAKRRAEGTGFTAPTRRTGAVAVGQQLMRDNNADTEEVQEDDDAN